MENTNRQKNSHIETAGINTGFNKSLQETNKMIWRILVEKIPSALLPKESVVLKDGSQMEISPVISLKEKSSADKSEVFLSTFGLSTDGKLLGTSRLHGTYDSTQKALRVSGSIEIQKTGIGAGKAITLSMSSLIQKICNSVGITAKWESMDRNLADLTRAKKKLDADPDNLEYQKQYSQKTKERNAWLKLFGEGGLLGFKPQTETVTEINFSPLGGEIPLGESEIGLFSGNSPKSTPEAIDYLKKVKNLLQNNTAE